MITFFCSFMFCTLDILASSRVERGFCFSVKCLGSSLDLLGEKCLLCLRLSLRSTSRDKRESEKPGRYYGTSPLLRLYILDDY